jgi:pyruvate,water dikinase
LGVSSGTASGILKSKEILDREKGKSKDSILYTESLSPDLTRYFDRVSGIVSNTGGLLSHLAIIAREKGIPTIVGFSISGSNIKIGDKVIVDGDTGKIIK